MSHLSSLTCSGYLNSVIDLLVVQYNLVNTDTKWTCHTVCIEWALGKITSWTHVDFIFVGRRFYLIRVDQFRFLGNCPSSPRLTQHFALSEKQVLIVMFFFIKHDPKVHGGLAPTLSQSKVQIDCTAKYACFAG